MKNTTIATAFEDAIDRLVFMAEDKKAVEYILMANGINPRTFFGEEQNVALWRVQSGPSVIKFDVWDDDGHEETVVVDLENALTCWKAGTDGASFTEWEDLSVEKDVVGDYLYYIEQREAWIAEEYDHIASSNDDDEISWSHQLISNWEEEIERAYSSLKNYDEVGNLIG